MRDNTTFEQAAAWARLDGVVSGDRPETAADFKSKFYWLVKATAPYQCPFCLVYLQGTPDERGAWLSELIAAADEEPQAHDGLRHIAAMLHSYNEPLPDMLRQWLIDYLSNKKPKPKKSGRPSDTEPVRDYAIVTAVKMLTDAGMQPGRSDTSDSICAYEEVGKAFNLAWQSVESVVKKYT